jgi:hypothetical protein
MRLCTPRSIADEPTRTRRLLAALLAVCGLLGAVLAIGLITSAPASADGDAAWAVRTAATDFGSNRQNYSYNLDPGGRLEDALVVVNRGAAALDLAVYAADGYTTDAGQLDLVTKDASSKGLGLWVHSEQSSLTIQPGESATVPFVLTVPANAQPGDYMGGMVTSLTRPDQTEGITVDRRLAVRILLRVGGELTPGMAVEDLRVAYSGVANPFAKGDATVSYTIRNTGNALLKARQAVSVAGPFGALRVRAGDLPDSPQLLPGDVWKVSVTVHDVAPALRLTATAIVTPLFTDASGTVAPIDAVEAAASTWSVPWALLLLIVAVAAGGVILLLVLRRGRRLASQRQDARVESAIEQALKERADAD